MELKEFLKYSKIETRSETSKFGDRSLGIPVELPNNPFGWLNGQMYRIGLRYWAQCAIVFYFMIFPMLLCFYFFG